MANGYVNTKSISATWQLFVKICEIIQFLSETITFSKVWKPIDNLGLKWKKTQYSQLDAHVIAIKVMFVITGKMYLNT